MKNTVLMLTLLTATAGAMASTHYNEIYVPSASKHADNTQPNIGGNAQQAAQQDGQQDARKVILRRSSM